MKQFRQLLEGRSVARLAGVGGRDSRRQAYTDVFTASCQASHRTSAKPANCRSYFVHIPKCLLFIEIMGELIGLKGVVEKKRLAAVAHKQMFEPFLPVFECRDDFAFQRRTHQ